MAAISASVSVGKALIATTDGHPERGHVRDVGGQVGAAPSDGLWVGLEERRVERLAGYDPAYPTMHLERPDGGHDDRRVGGESGGPALDVEELLGAHVGAEARLGDHDLGRRERSPVGEDRAVAVGDVAERAAVDERRATLERLEQVGLDGVAQEHGHRARDLEVVRRDRGAVPPGRSTIRPSRARRSWRSLASARMAMTSDATVITNSVSRG